MAADCTLWNGVLVASALPLPDDLTIDLDRCSGHVAWLAAAGCAGVTPNGSPGAGRTLTAAERDRLAMRSSRVYAAGFQL